MATPQDFITLMLQALQAQQQQQNAGQQAVVTQQGQNQQNLARTQRATAQDVLFGQRLGRYGTPIDRETGTEVGNPFDNGFFKTNAERQSIIDDRQVGMPTAADLPSNPYYQDWAAAFTTPNTSVDAPLPFTQILNQPITPAQQDGGASAQARTQRAMASLRRPNPFSIF